MGLLRILYLDDDVAAVDKPDGVLVHRSRQSRDHVFVLQLLRDQLGAFVYPVHRLDRAASGVLLFARSPEMAARLVESFGTRTVHKVYEAIVRGHLEGGGRIDYALKDPDTGASQDAVTDWTALAGGRIDEHAYTWVCLEPQTGRQHQLRRHLKHISHPILGDTTYGDGKHNRLFRERLGVRRLLLHACRIELPHPRTGRPLCVEAPRPAEFDGAIVGLGLQLPPGARTQESV